MKIKIVSVCFLWVFALIPAAFAGKTELTTYYPAPYGEYQNLTVTGNNVNDINLYNGSVGLRVITSDSATAGAGGAITLGGSYTGTTPTGLASIRGGLEAAGSSNGYLGLYTTRSGTGSVEAMRITSGGNVGIGTSAPTVQFERACPSGFTNIKAGNNQLGCMQTDEANGGVAALPAASEDYCFDNYGGRLPTVSEWVISMTNFALNNEIDDWERCGDVSKEYGVGVVHAIAGATSIQWSVGTDDNHYAFRCWIPK